MIAWGSLMLLKYIVLFELYPPYPPFIVLRDHGVKKRVTSRASPPQAMTLNVVFFSAGQQGRNCGHC